MRIKLTSTYKNWIYFMLPLLFFLLLELYFKWPYNAVVPGSEAVYLQSSVLFVGLYLPLQFFRRIFIQYLCDGFEGLTVEREKIKTKR